MAPGFRPKSSRRCAGSRKSARASERTGRWVGARRARLRAGEPAMRREIRDRGHPVSPGMADLAVPRVMGDTSDAPEAPDPRRAVTRATPSGTSEAAPRVPVTIVPIVTVAPSAPVTSVTTVPLGPIVTRVLPRGLRHVPSGGRFARIAPASRARARVRLVPRPFRTIRRSRASCRS